MNRFLSYIVILFFIFNFSAVPVFAQQKFYTTGPKDVPQIAFTFDDGPGPKTNAVLDILKKYNVRATFFIQGSQVKLYPEIVKQVHNAGHELGNHTQWHRNFYKYKTITKEVKRLLISDIKLTEQSILQQTGYQPHLIRMPHGYCKPWAIEIIYNLGYTLINWDYGVDWRTMSAEKLEQAYLPYLQPGKILLMHDGWQKVPILDVLPRLIQKCQDKGLQIVPVSELLNLNSKGD